MTEFDSLDSELSPTSLVANTVNEYDTLLTRPSNITEVSRGPTDILPPRLLAIMVYPVSGLPPSPDGAAQLIKALVLPAEAVTLVGASGIPSGVTDRVASDSALFPAALTALTVKV